MLIFMQYWFNVIDYVHRASKRNLVWAFVIATNTFNKSSYHYEFEWKSSLTA